MEKQPLILFAYLTNDPTSDKTMHDDAGLLFLEDTKKALICQV